MPTYDFRCTNGHSFERFFGRISEAPTEVQCPECGAMGTRQISGGAGLIFKGSGFYITDYGKDGKKDQRSRGGSSEGSSSTGVSSTSAKTESSSTSTSAGSSNTSTAPAPSAPSSSSSNE